MGVINSQFDTDATDARIVLNGVVCNSSVFIGAAVIMSGGIAVNGLADSLAHSNVIGICEAKPSATLCNIRVLGLTDGNIFAGLDETKEYYLSETVAGQISDTIPVTSGSVILKIGQPFNATSLLVLKGQRTVRA